MTEFITIDGAEGEGGGQMVRSALALSAVTGKPFRMVNIRQNRPNPGLRSQHVQCVAATREICGASVEGAQKQSRELTFVPAEIRAGSHAIDIGTAGSTTLVLQTIALPLSFAAGVSDLTIMGGTHNDFAPIYDYIELTWLPIMRRIGLDIEAEIRVMGFYPRGGGEIRATIRPCAAISPLILTERGHLHNVSVMAMVNNLPYEIAERFVKRAESGLRSSRVRKIKTAINTASGPGRGGYVRIVADYDGTAATFTGLARIGKQTEKIADETVEEFIEFNRSSAAVDPRLADQIILPLSLASGPSAITTSHATSHLRTNAAVIKKFLPVEIKIDEKETMCLVTVSPQKSGQT